MNTFPKTVNENVNTFYGWQMKDGQTTDSGAKKLAQLTHSIRVKKCLFKNIRLLPQIDHVSACGYMHEARALWFFKILNIWVIRTGVNESYCNNEAVGEAVQYSVLGVYK